ncbi:TIR domain-containing protein [Actinomadura scrupuli]|uniref:TIR domain-containing protein n=1 Tax=Actinomadura scrupuli TaxID=559629 RepID=UPI003D963770
MITYWFELRLAGPIDLDAASERLYAICSDGQLAGDEDGGSVMFSREAGSAIEAIISAIDDTEKAQLTVLDVAGDLVTVDEIAEKTNRSVAAVGHWSTGKRGGGRFPHPVVDRSSKVRLYSWAEVSQWLADHGLGGVDQAAAEVATAAAEISALLHARHALLAAPDGHRELLEHILSTAPAGQRESADRGIIAPMPGLVDEAPPPVVFLSYASEDKFVFAEPLARALARLGIQLWLDMWEMSPSDSLVQRLIDEGLARANAVILIASKYSVTKPWIREEFDNATVQRINRGTRLIPVRLDTVEMPMPLERLAWIDAKRSDKDVQMAAQSIADTVYGHSLRSTTRSQPTFTGSSVSRPGFARPLAFTLAEEPGLSVRQEEMHDRLIRDRNATAQHGTGGKRHHPAWSGRNCTILLTDIVSSGTTRDADHHVIRRTIYDILRDAFERSGLQWSMCYYEDRGDGALIIIPPDIPTHAIVDPLLVELTARVRRYNRQVRSAARFQLRAALHVGTVVSDPVELAGEAVVLTAGLLDSPILKRRLKETSADVGFITSMLVYETAIKRDAAKYRKIEFQANESKLTAWMWIADQD